MVLCPKKPMARVPLPHTKKCPFVPVSSCVDVGTLLSFQKLWKGTALPSALVDPGVFKLFSLSKVRQKMLRFENLRQIMDGKICCAS